MAESLKVMVSMPDMLSAMASGNVDLAIHIAPSWCGALHLAESLKVMVSMPDMLSAMASGNVDLAIHIAPARVFV